MRKVLASALAGTALALLCLAAPGRAAPGEANPLMAGRGGDIVFPVSCGAALQPRFDAALAALHSFWYSQALEEFTHIAEADPDCAMAHWGVSMTQWNQLWAPPQPASLKRGADAVAKREDPLAVKGDSRVTRRGGGGAARSATAASARSR